MSERRQCVRRTLRPGLLLLQIQPGAVGRHMPPPHTHTRSRFIVVCKTCAWCAGTLGMAQSLLSDKECWLRWAAQHCWCLCQQSSHAACGTGTAGCMHVVLVASGQAPCARYCAGLLATAGVPYHTNSLCDATPPYAGTWRWIQ